MKIEDMRQLVTDLEASGFHDGATRWLRTLELCERLEEMTAEIRMLSAGLAAAQRPDDSRRGKRGGRP